jgi:hypothetical protein
VKHLLILLFFLLLTSPVIGQSDEKCYVVVDSAKDIDTSLLSNISISLISKFVRDVEQLPPSGISLDSCQYQILVSKNNDTTFVTFKGEGLNSYGDSKLSGSDGFQQSILKSLYRSLKDKRDIICQNYGTLLEECNEVIKKQIGVLFGTYSKTKWDEGGEWKWYKNDNDNRYGRYKGEIEDDLPNGKGIVKTTTGIIYLGEFKDGLPNGKGITIYPDGETYTGKYMKGIRNGQITHTFPSGQKYEGELKDGVYHGKGTYTFPDGESYVGEFKDGKENGKGTYTFSSRKKYVGEFKDGLPNGLGTYIHTNGGKYVGEFKDGNGHGQGTYINTNGGKYVGEFKDGVPNGQGTVTFPDGENYVGEFKDDKIWTGIFHTNYGIITEKIMNGKSIEQ